MTKHMINQCEMTTGACNQELHQCDIEAATPVKQSPVFLLDDAGGDAPLATENAPASPGEKVAGGVGVSASASDSPPASCVPGDFKKNGTPEKKSTAFGGTENPAAELLEALKYTVRICEAMRYSAGLGKYQLERLARAKALIVKHERSVCDSAQVANLEVCG